MKRKRIFTILVLVLLTCALSTTAFAIDERKVPLQRPVKKKLPAISSSGSCVPLGFSK